MRRGRVGFGRGAFLTMAVFVRTNHTYDAMDGGGGCTHTEEEICGIGVQWTYINMVGFMV